jgi:putative transposase
MVGRPMPPLVLSEDDVQQLQALANSRSLPHSIVQRAQIVLACGAGEANTAIAKRMGLTGMTVGKWRKRYLEQGLEGLHDELRPGRPRTYEDEDVAEVINRALQTRPTDGSTHWSARSLAAATGISKSTVHRWLQTFSVQPHRQKHFKLSTDPFFVEKFRDIVGLYLWAWATTAPTSTPRTGPGWRNAPASMCTTHPPMPLGSIRWSAGLGSSPSGRFGGAASPVSSRRL